MTSKNSSILITGGNGFLGNLLVTSLLKKTNKNLVLLLRGKRFNREFILKRILNELNTGGSTLTQTEEKRIILCPLPEEDDLSHCLSFLKNLQIQEIVHSAGCVSYFDKKKLIDGNENLTQKILDLGCHLQIEKFFFISTAFSCGLVDGLIKEDLHDEPKKDPTDYTKSKRNTEKIVAESGLPFVIIRPSVVIGHSQTGHYSGRPYGLYQFYFSVERFLVSKYRSIMHIFAPKTPLHFLHQDAFQKGFMAAYKHLKAGSIFNLVSPSTKLPSMNGIWRYWIKHCFKPKKAFLYENFKEVPFQKLDDKEKLWLEMTATNQEIGSIPWNFETNHLEFLKKKGLNFPETSLESTFHCSSYFIRQSNRIQKYLQTIPKDQNDCPEMVERNGSRGLKGVDSFAAFLFLATQTTPLLFPY